MIRRADNAPVFRPDATARGRTFHHMWHVNDAPADLRIARGQDRCRRPQ